MDKEETVFLTTVAVKAVVMATIPVSSLVFLLYCLGEAKISSAQLHVTDRMGEEDAPCCQVVR